MGLLVPSPPYGSHCTFCVDKDISVKLGLFRQCDILNEVRAWKFSNVPLNLFLDGGTSAQSSLANTSHASTVWKTILTRDLADTDNAVAYKGR